jgi:hypothetical protein
MKKEELEIVIKRADSIFKKIKDKYVNLSGYLVFSSRYGQCELTSNLIEILKVFPEMIRDSESKEKAADLLKKISIFEKAKNDSYSMEKKKIAEKEIKKASDILDLYITELDVKDDTFIEIRFRRLLYDPIFEIQKDSLVSQKHTPQTQASVRIVVGTLSELYDDQEKE